MKQIRNLRKQRRIPDKFQTQPGVDKKTRRILGKAKTRKFDSNAYH